MFPHIAIQSVADRSRWKVRRRQNVGPSRQGRYSDLHNYDAERSQRRPVLAATGYPPDMMELIHI